MSSSTATACFNSNCKELSEKRWRGWRRRTGEYVQLCDRCSAVYEEGKFCETFHLNASGWRCCESCGKQIHCGCIVSFHMFVLLDAGGIECLTCAKKSYILTPNPAWPPPSHILPSKPERMKDLSIKSWSALAGSGPVPWRQAPSVFSSLNFQSDTQPGMPSGINVSGTDVIDRFHICERLATNSAEMKQETSFKRFLNLKQESSFERLLNGTSGFGSYGSLQNGSAGLNQKGHFYRSTNDFQPILSRSDSSSNFNLATASSCKTETDDTHGTIISIQSDKHICCHNGVVSGEIQVLNGKAPQDGRGRNKLLTQHHPLTTHEDLQHIASDSKTGITPLFEKKLTASDVGRVGRLVLPKKCAEAYFPPLAHPEGEALKVQEVKGKEWVFHFRYWPNNNSRMYVLDGITPCIQSMQLQAGDVVTFSRLEPEGKLVIGGRKSSVIPSSNQGNEGTVVTSGTSIPRDDSTRNKSGDVYVNCTVKDKPANSIFPINQAAKADMGISQSDIDKSGYIAKNVRESNLVIKGKKNNCNLGMKSKRLKIENQDSLELHLTWNEAQGLMRQPGGTVPSVFVVEGWEFEEFEEAPPVIGRPTIIWTDNFGKKIRLVQCEDCFKWRKVPADAHLPSRWICSGNVWDLDRSSCLVAEELAKEQLDDMLRSISKVSAKEERIEQDPDPCVALEGLDTLANLAIQEEGGGSKHPRHKPGCPCVTCLHPPPSGIGLNHKQPCDCILCTVLKHRFRTLMERRGNRQPENNESRSTKSPLKGEIDLNTQPEREEELVLHGSESAP